MQATHALPIGAVGRPLLRQLSKNWWLLLLRGVAAIAFGIVAFAWPGLTLLTLVLVYAAYALVDGIFALIAAFSGAKSVPTWWLITVGLLGVLGIAAGIVAFLWPGMTAVILVMLIGAWAIMHGIFEIAGAFRLRREIDGEWMLILGGFVSVLFGVAALVFPGQAAVALIWVVAIYAILFGLFMIALALRFKGLRVRA